MNHTYRLVFNRSQNAWVAVAETAKSHSKGGKAKAMAAAVASVLAFNALAMPTGGQVSAGSGNIAQSGNTMTVTQTSQNLAINWNSFGIAANETVNFAQPSASAIALNRVLGSDPSAIYGKLNANGQVFLLNPNGVLFGKTAQVNVGGLVASTLNLSDADFMARNFRFTGSAGSVKNEGAINAADNGYAALLGGQVSNQGSIVAKLGNVSLAAGQDITLDFAGDKLISVRVSQGVIDALAENKQLIVADGGTVLLTAQAANALIQAVVNNEGVIEARTVDSKSGTIRLMGDMQNGIVKVGGTLDASAPLPPLQGEGRGGDGAANGGFIETSAAKVKVAHGAKVTTKAAQGLNGSWLIDPVDFTIDANGDISGADLGTLLGSGDITLQTATGLGDGTNMYGTSGTNGDIFVNEAVSWSANLLTLRADRNIEINANLNASGAAGLDLRYGQGAVAAGNTASYNLNNGAKVNLASTASFYTKLGSDGTPITYTIVTTLGTDGGAASTLGGINSYGGFSGKYVLGADIDATPTATWNTGRGFVIGGWLDPFTGILDGLGHTIDKLYINDTGTSTRGLVGKLSGTMRNLTMTNVDVTGGQYVGAVAAIVDSGGAIRNVHVGGTVKGSYYAGGLVGQNKGAVADSSFSGTVDGGNSGQRIGGLVGTNRYRASSIANSSFSGTVTGSSTVGGLAGGNEGSIVNSDASGAVTGSSFVGGLTGSSGPTISNSHYDIEASGLGFVGRGGLYHAQFQDWVSHGHSLDIANYFTANTAGSYQIASLQGLKDLLGFAESNNPAYKFVLTTNLDLATLPSGFSIPLFNAPLLDGGGNTLSNYTVSASGSGGVHVGFIGTLGAGSTVSRLGLTNASVTGGVYVGGLVVDNSGTIDQSYFTGTVTGDLGATIGGLVGYNAASGRITNSHAVVTVSGGGSWAGGLAGGNGGLIDSSYATGRVDGSDYVGGLVGGNMGAITNSYAEATVTGSNANVGGLVGYAGVSWDGSSASTIDNSHATGDVTGGSSFVGGLVGQHNKGTITNSYATGIVRGADYAGGLVGISSGTTSIIDNSYATGAVTGTRAVGGLVGQNYGTVSNSHASIGRVTGTGDYVGGLVGANNGTVSNSHATRDVSGGARYVGGLVGRTNYGSVSASYATGAVSGASYVGGLVGRNNGTSSTIGESYATGTVTGTEGAVGGLTGQNDGAISNSYATGAASGDSNVGGLVGSNYGSIDKSYASGLVSGTTNVGGLVGYHDTSSSIYSVTSSFWDKETSGQTASASGTGLTTAEMKTLANFNSATMANGNSNPNWDFANTWYMADGLSKPLLRALMVPLTVTANDATKTYDGLAYSGSAGVTYSVAPVMANLEGTLTYTSGTNVGSYPITLGGLVSNQSYLISFVDGTLTINPALVTATTISGSLVGTVQKTYDGSNAAVLAAGNYSLTGFVGSDGATVTKTVGTYASSNAGSGIAVTVNLGNSDYAAAGTTNLANYILPTVISGNVGVITPRALTVSGSSVASKIYDGTTAASLSAGSLSGLVNGETLGLSISGAFDSKNAGNRTVAAHYALSDGSGLASNYSVSDASLSGTISPKSLSVSGTTVAGKTYDGTTTAAVTAGSVSGAVAGETLGLRATGNFDSKNAGNRTVAVHYALADGSGLASNYSVTDESFSAVITPKALTVSGIVAANKTYDGTTAATVNAANAKLDGLVAGDAVSLAATGVFADKNAGTAKTVTLNDTLSGADAGNYSVTAQASTTADIAPKALSIAGSTAQNKQYDGTTTATVTPGTLSGFVGNETVSVGQARGSFEDATVGERKKVTAQYVLANGANGGLAGNYSLASETLTANITEAETYKAAISSVQQPLVLNNTPAAGQGGLQTGGQQRTGGGQGAGQGAGQAGGDGTGGNARSDQESSSNEKGVDGGTIGVPVYLAPKPVFKIVSTGMKLPDGLMDNPD